MQTRPLKRHAINPQLGMEGSVVNVAADINGMMELLPRSFDNMAIIIQVRLKRHIDHAPSYLLFKSVSPSNVSEALDYTKDTPLHVKHKNKSYKDFIKKYEVKFEDRIDFVVDPTDVEIDRSLCRSKWFLRRTPCHRQRGSGFGRQ